jgi:hypothetical protein
MLLDDLNRNPSLIMDCTRVRQEQNNPPADVPSPSPVILQVRNCSLYRLLTDFRFSECGYLVSGLTWY